MSLSNVLEEIKKVKPYVDEDVESGPYQTLAGRRGRKLQAIESMKRLKRQYTTELLQSAAFIVVVGDKRDVFVSTAVESYKCFSSDPNSFFNDLANKVPPAAYLGRESVANLFDILGRHLEDKAFDLDIVGYPQLIFRQEYGIHLNTKEDFYNLVRRAVSEQLGGELVAIQATHDLADEAISKEHSAKITPILLSTDNDQFALTLVRDLEKISNKVFLISAGRVSKTIKGAKTPEQVIAVKDPTGENVENALKTISNSLKR